MYANLTLTNQRGNIIINIRHIVSIGRSHGSTSVALVNGSSYDVEEAPAALMSLMGPAFNVQEAPKPEDDLSF